MVSLPEGRESDHLAILPHPRLRELLPHVGHYISGAATSTDRASTKRPEGGVPGALRRRVT
ncbi:hypothetical protein VDGL01_10004 [Verticillium dahliae]